MGKITPRRVYFWGRRRLRGLPVLRDLHRAQYDDRRRAHAAHLRALHPDDVRLLEELEEHGICVLPVRDLGWPSTDAMLAELETFTGELRAASSPRGNKISWDRMAAAPAARDWGLNERALALAHNYIGLPLLYSGPQIRRECVTGDDGGVRKWHLDVEDRRVLKLIIYAEDVAAGGGPFEYLTLPATEQAVARLRYTVGLVDGRDMASAGVRPDDAVAALAPKHTAVLVDAGRLFHRVQPPRTSDRYSATYCWMSVFGDRDHHLRGRVVDAA